MCGRQTMSSETHRAFSKWVTNSKTSEISVAIVSLRYGVGYHCFQTRLMVIYHNLSHPSARSMVKIIRAKMATPSTQITLQFSDEISKACSKWPLPAIDPFPETIRQKSSSQSFLIHKNLYRSKADTSSKHQHDSPHDLSLSFLSTVFQFIFPGLPIFGCLSCFSLSDFCHNE